MASILYRIQLSNLDRVNDAINVYNMFWEVVNEFDENTQKKIILFQSGLPYVIPNKRYTITVINIPSNTLPTAHTFSLDLVLSLNYTKEILKQKLLTANIEAKTFELVGGATRNYRYKYLKYKKKYLHAKSLFI